MASPGTNQLAARKSVVASDSPVSDIEFIKHLPESSSGVVMKRLFACTLMLFAAAPSLAVDANGYTAKYEKSIGTPPPCSVTITSSSDPNWGKLNDSSYPVICLTPGDYGTITLTASGASGKERWLRYKNPNNTGTHPVQQSAADRAKIKRLVFNGADYWIIHHITIEGGGAGTRLIEFVSGSSSTNNIVSSVLAEDVAENAIYVGFGNNNNTIQNSVIRDCIATPGQDRAGVSISGGPINTHIINNEIYGCQKAVYISEHQAEGTVIENNDLYFSMDQYTDCSGNYNGTGPCSASEVVIGTKNAGISSNLVRILHNRLWGGRRTDTSVCCAGGGSYGKLMSISGKDSQDTNGSKYVLIQNNILMDSQIGLDGYWANLRNHSVIGNVFYNIHAFHSTTPTRAIATEGGHTTYSEYYLNTIIDADVWFDFGGATNNDVKCNVIIDSGGIRSYTGNGTQVDYNAFYNTSLFTTGSVATNISYQSASDTKNIDYCFMRKLITGPEQFCIPYARPISSVSPHDKTCDSSFDSRQNIGIDDKG